MRIEERIEKHYAELGPQEQKAADTLLDRLGDLAVYNAAELAGLSGVSKATMSRLFRHLGFANFNEVKEHTRSLRSSDVPLASQGPDGGLPRHRAVEQDNLDRLWGSLDDARLLALSRQLVEAGNVLLIGFRNSFPLALHLRQQLLQCRSSVHVAPQPGQSLGEELAGLDGKDVVVFLGFRRRPATFERALRAAAATGATTVLIGDPSGRWLAGSASVWIECPVEGSGAFDSYASAMSLMSVLANGVMAASGRKGRERVRKITGVFDGLGEIERR
ncbi:MULTISPECIES: MurR/RpiR family transcriptional regulator [Arthrobacter]|uniref:MurR/RpiR family transcriptional regulator n=1 Tax=Arthrobacter terricola TaxID=2547396 RepID=A0A4R5K6I3_9MICC|nr:MULTISPECIES: MurR/RpiR family transcriptional regulator [Arthrobacter]MBT8163730.1 MurR/RpiR family transcriptional regulator [Arthrobacter sp. GN70]TDF87207.1 MurR/RpiR family transcriptional regulator [Arthrobacter terricola]